MQKLVETKENLDWVIQPNTVETYMSDMLPDVSLCPSAYALVFKNGALLMSDLREGERPTRRLDIPGGHCDAGETPEQTAIRETFEETGVRVKSLGLVGYTKVTITGQKPNDYPYPYPTGYMAYYVCEVIEETDFVGNDDTHGRVWLLPGEFDTCNWCIENKIFLDEVIKTLETK